MADETEKRVVFEFTKLLKKNPNLLANVLPFELKSSSTSVSKNKQAVADEQSEEPEQNVEGIALNSSSASYSSEDLLKKRSRNGKGSGAQQTFRVSELKLYLLYILSLHCSDLWSRPGSWRAN